MQKRILDHINDPKDLRQLDTTKLSQLSKEIRDFVINMVATKEGHLGASLGVVELTVALHYIFETPNDLLVWDVGHQAYPHKILTGRSVIFDTNRQLNGISGFPKRSESIYDTFGTGHSSTAISAVLGMAIASGIKGDNDKQHIAVVGDASIASGMAFEGLNHAGVTEANILVILNDNAIGIDPSVGALKAYLTKTKSGDGPKQDNIFEALNFDYYGPIDGHDLPLLLTTLSKLKKIKGPKFLHVVTTKGKGLQKAEEQQVTYHAPGKFDAKTGELLPKKAKAGVKFQEVFGRTILELAKSNTKIVGITPAMPTGSSLKYMMEAFPDRAFDVGIAEQHAVTLCAGMATQGLVPFCTIYSTFLQRAYDQIIHDVALQNLPVIFCVDRAGLVGADGATHHGVFDIAYLRCIPNMIVAAPENAIAFRNMLYTASLGLENPIAIRYPRGLGTIADWQQPFEKLSLGKGIQLNEGTTHAILSIGTMAKNVTTALAMMETPELVAHYAMRFVKPLDQELLHAICQKYNTIFTIEDHVITGGFGSAVGEFIHANNYTNKLVILGISDQFIDHGTTAELHEITEISPQKIYERLQKVFS